MSLARQNMYNKTYGLGTLYFRPSKVNFFVRISDFKGGLTSSQEDLFFLQGSLHAMHVIYYMKYVAYIDKDR